MPEYKLQRDLCDAGICAKIYCEARRSKTGQAASYLVRTANFVDVRTAPLLRGLLCVDVVNVWTLKETNPFVSCG